EAECEVPVGARDVDRGEPLLPELLEQRLPLGGELVDARWDLQPDLLEQVGAVRDDARAGIVRDAVELAVVPARRGQTRDPGARVRERRPVGGEILER